MHSEVAAIYLLIALQALDSEFPSFGFRITFLVLASFFLLFFLAIIYLKMKDVDKKAGL